MATRKCILGFFGFLQGPGSLLQTMAWRQTRRHILREARAQAHRYLDLLLGGPWKSLLFTALTMSTWSQQGVFAQLTITPIPSHSIEGENVTLAVQGLPGDLLSYNWIRGPIYEFNLRIVNYNFLNHKHSVGSAYTGRETGDPNGSLNITNVWLNDSGVFTLQLISGQGNTLYHGTLLVSERVSPPNITVQDNRPMEHQDSVNLTCTPLNSGVTLRWLVNNELILEGDRFQFSPDRRILTIPRVTRNDAGTYQCEARNEVMFSLSSPLVINVTYGPDTPSVSSLGSDFVIGSNLTLSCFANSNPAAQYTWWVNGTEGPPGQQLFIPNISGRHSGVYTCNATNPLSGLHSMAETSISISDTLTQPGIVANNSGPVENKDSVNLTCVPPRSTVAIFWYKDGEVLLGGQGLDLSPDNRTLTLEVVTRNDSGLYQCGARNPAVASISAPATLKVIYGPDTPILNPSNSTFVEGSDLTISCFSDSNPPAQYKWEIDGTPGPSTQHLFIPYISLANAGMYTCEASNLITHHRSIAQARIQVSEAPNQGSNLYGRSISSGGIAGISLGLLVGVILTGIFGYFVGIMKSQIRSAVEIMAARETEASTAL